jgi:pimeloyl-ACP methyl ester carboxylesterase
MKITHSLCLLAVASIFPHAAVAQRVDTVWATVHGHRVHFVVSGSEGPTVVLEAGAGSTHRTWERLRQQLGPSIRVVAYDRPGFGRSEACPNTRDALTIARELHAALAAVRLAPPYLLVGWSAGGIYMRVFASEFAPQVAGLVLLDPAPEDFYEKAARTFPDVFRRLDAIDSASIRSGPQAELAEDAAWEDALAQARRSDAGLRAPVVLLSALRPDLEVLADIWHAEQRAWTERQPSRVFRIVAQAGHAIHRDRADTVARVIQDAIARLPRPRSP